MKNNKFLFWGTLIMGMVALLAAACATTGGSGTPPAPDKQAAQLAAKINAVKAGSAQAEGGTVRLAGDVNLTGSLTVPEGLTLDLSADGAVLRLRNGATLTVDGTVNTRGHGDAGKGWVDGGLCVEDGETVINGSGTIRLQSKGCLLNIWSGKRHLTLDGVTLLGIADNTHPLVQVGGGGELVMKSGAITGNARIGRSPGGGLVVHDKGTTFTMEGGAISGNSTQDKENASGGGVFVGNDATFTMSGGAITDNSATGGTYANGGGVFISDAVFTMSGGTISGNAAASGNGGNGGGVRVSGSISTFTMQGGTIYGKADSLPAGTDASLANSARGGASLDVYKSTAKWGRGGTYKGGESQTGGGDIVHSDPDSHVGTDATLIAIPAK
jgi:hypothetical protein